ncbi:unnamed protein product [Sympodiomycopsis kandeliae]
MPSCFVSQGEAGQPTSLRRCLRGPSISVMQQREHLLLIVLIVKHEKNFLILSNSLQQLQGSLFPALAAQQARRCCRNCLFQSIEIERAVPHQSTHHRRLQPATPHRIASQLDPDTVDRRITKQLLQRRGKHPHALYRTL